MRSVGEGGLRWNISLGWDELKVETIPLNS